jgi:hypothetical protein
MYIILDARNNLRLLDIMRFDPIYFIGDCHFEDYEQLEARTSMQYVRNGFESSKLAE